MVDGQQRRAGKGFPSRPAIMLAAVRVAMSSLVDVSALPICGISAARRQEMKMVHNNKAFGKLINHADL